MKHKIIALYFLLAISAIAGTNAVRVGNQLVRVGNQIVIVDTFSPDEIAGLALWFDASDASTITIRTNAGLSYVTRFESRIGTNYVDQDTEDRQPIFTNNVGRNGNTAIYLDTTANSQARLNNKDFNSYSSIFNSTNLTWFSAFWLLDTNTPSGQGYVWEAGITTNGSDTNSMTNLQADKQSNQRMRYRYRVLNDSYGGNNRSTEFLVPTNNMLCVAWGSWYTNDSTLDVINRGILISSSNSGAGDYPRDKDVVEFALMNRIETESNNRRFEPGMFFESLWYTNVLTEVEQNKVKDYLLLKWRLREWKPYTPAQL